MSQEHSTSSIPTTIPSFRFNPEAAEFHCGKDLDNSFSSAADSVTTGYPPQFGKVDGNHKYFTPGFPQIYTKFGGQYSKSESSSYTGPHTQGFYGPYLTVPTPYSRSEGFSTMGTRYQQNHGLFSGSYSDGGYPHSPDYNSYSGSQVGSISERYDAPSGYLTPQNGGLPSRYPSPELLLVPETIAGRAYSIPAELQALHCFKNILSDLCVTCPINLEQYDRETVLRRAMDRLTGKIKHPGWDGKYRDYREIWDVMGKAYNNFIKVKLIKQDAGKNRLKGETKKEVMKRMWKEKGQSGNRKGGHQYRRFDRYYDVLPGGQSAGGYMDNGFPGTDLYEAKEQYYSLKEHVENYKAEGWGPVRREE